MAGEELQTDRMSLLEMREMRELRATCQWELDLDGRS
jgi:hypothetical protein